MNFLIKITKLVLIPVILFIAWVYLSFVYNTKYPYLAVVSDYGTEVFSNYTTEKLIKGNIVEGSFTGTQNNLGIVSIRFLTHLQINTDKLIFRIKQSDGDEWLHESIHNVDQFQPNDLFPFGFEPQTDSKNKQYIFQLESTAGSPKNAISLSKDFPVVLATYKYTKSDVLRSTESLFAFLRIKAVNYLQDHMFLLESFVYAQPFLLYVLTTLIRKNKKINLWMNKIILKAFNDATITHSKIKPYTFIFVLLIIALAFFVPKAPFIMKLILISTWIFTTRKSGDSFKSTLTVSIFLLILCPLFVVFGKVDPAIRIAEWFYYFFSLGSLQAFAQHLRK